MCPRWQYTDLTYIGGTRLCEPIQPIFNNNRPIAIRTLFAKFEVPKLLNFDQKIFLMSNAQKLFYYVNDDPSLLKRVTTGDESWTYGLTLKPKPNRTNRRAEKNKSPSLQT